jgi:regulator of sigma D
VIDSQLDKIAEIAQKVSAENDRRQRQLDTINELLQERQEVLVSMCGLAELEGKEPNPAAIIDSLVSFTQTLVDYTALGHFEIYERIIEGKERRMNVQSIANRVYPSISLTTEKFIEFNDKYDGADDADSITGLYQDLSDIGEAFAERIESEDQLLREMSDRLFNQ